MQNLIIDNFSNFFSLGITLIHFFFSNNKDMPPAAGTVTGKAAHNFKPIPPGTQVHDLTVIGYAGSRKNSSGKRKSWYSCRCICGELKQVMGTHLRQGLVTSCGCRRKNMARARMTLAIQVADSILKAAV